MKQNYLKDRKKLILLNMTYIILILSIFSDILRIENTSLTLFRLCLPVAIIIIAMFPNLMKKFVCFCLGLTVVTCVQYWIFYKVLQPEIDFSFSIALKFYILYICILIVFFLVKVIEILNGDMYEVKFTKFILLTGYILIVLACIDHFYPAFFGSLQADNQNNYGCFIAALIPFLLVAFGEGYSKWKNGIVICFCILLLYINDSKAALFGVMVELIIFFCINKDASNRSKFFMYRYMILIVFVVMVLVILILNPAINGYHMRDTIFHPIERILTNNPYPDYLSSISYRTNTTLYVLIVLFQVKFIGVGMGNTGVLLKHAFPNLNPEYEMAINSPFISLHNAWLEFALDLGIIALVIYFFAIKYVLKLYFGKKKMSQIEKVRIIYIISFPIWVISASGIYTQYYLMVIMGFLLFMKKDMFVLKKEE